jgi:hypothetical protein
VAILATFKTQYEFIFTCGEEYFLETVCATFKGFKKSMHYRETMICSSALFHDGELIILKKETVFEKLSGVFHLSADIGTIGCLTITNTRIVWYCGDSLSNLSLPYLHIVKSLSLIHRRKWDYRNQNMGRSCNYFS